MLNHQNKIYRVKEMFYNYDEDNKIFIKFYTFISSFLWTVEFLRLMQWKIDFIAKKKKTKFENLKRK